MMWAIQDGEGMNFCEGIQFERQARLRAQELANKHGESVYIYNMADGENAELEEIEPESD